MNRSSVELDCRGGVPWNKSVLLCRPKWGFSRGLSLDFRYGYDIDLSNPALSQYYDIPLVSASLADLERDLGTSLDVPVRLLPMSLVDDSVSDS